MILTKKHTVSSGMSDSSANMSVIGMFQTVEDTVTELMGRQNIDGVTIKRLYNAVWVFVRSKIRMFKRIPWNDVPFTANGFITYVSSARLEIDVALRGEDGELLAYSRTEICALDMTTGRIRRTSTVGVTADIPVYPAECDIVFGELDFSDGEQVDEITVRSTNIDLFHHTNNKEYVRFIMNTYSVDFIESHFAQSIEMKFVGQTHENDKLQLYKRPDDDRLCEVRFNGKSVAKCRIEWNPL